MNDSQLSQQAWKLINYLNFKMDCAREAEEVGVRLDYDKCQEYYKTLLEQQTQKNEELSKAMPKKAITKKVNKPKVIRKKDGSLSAHGERWFALLEEQGLPLNTVGPVEVVTGYEDGNPSSSEQVKDWLHSLGWKPQTYKFVRDKQTGEERKIEQVRDDGELCDSVVDLVDKDPAVGILEGLTVINHRIGIFKSFLDCAEKNIDGQWFLKAKVAGLTNTFRFKHAKPLVNLPGVDKPWGSEIRGVLIAGDDELFCGSDMVSLEDTCKRHYMQPLDPDYVEEMSQSGFDPHLDLAVKAGKVTQDEYEFYKWFKSNGD